MKNPLVEYYQEAYDGFEYMKERMKQQIVKNLLMSELAPNPKGEVIMYFPEDEENMTVYNINLGIGWASSGVEYA